MGLKSRAVGLGVGCWLLAFGCVEPANYQIQVVDPCNQAALRDAERIRVEAIDVATGERWSSSFGADSNSGSLPEIPIGATVNFDVSLLRDGAVFAWTMAGPFTLSASADDNVELQPSRVDAITKPHVVGNAGQCASYTNSRAGGRLLTLDDGNVMHLGGYEVSDALTFVKDIALWNARDNTLEHIGTLDFPRVDDSALQLPDGSWVLSGGRYEAVQGTTGAREEGYFTLTLHVSSDGQIDAVPGQLNVGRAGHQSVLLEDGRIWLLGGRGGLGSILETEIYDPVTKTSETGPSLSSGRWDMGVVSLGDDTVVLVGGEGDGGLLDTIETIRLSDSIGSVSALRLSTARTRPYVVQHDDTFWVLGGGTVAGTDINRGRGSISIDGFRRGGNGFEALCADTGIALSEGRFLSSVLVDGDSIYLAGGYDGDGVLLKSVDVLNVSSLESCEPNIGETVAELGEARAYMAGALLDSGLMMFGGGQSRVNGDNASSALVELYRRAR